MLVAHPHPQPQPQLAAMQPNDGALPGIRGRSNVRRRSSTAAVPHAGNVRRRSSTAAAPHAGKSVSKHRGGRRRSSRLADISHLHAQLTRLSCGQPSPAAASATAAAPQSQPSSPRVNKSMSMTELCEHARMSETSAALTQAKLDVSTLSAARAKYTRTRDLPTASENMKRLALEHARGKALPRGPRSAAEAIQNQRARRARGAGSAPEALAKTAKTPEQRWRNRRQSNSSVLSLPGL